MTGAVAGRRVKACPVSDAGAGGGGQGVVAVEDQPLAAELAELTLLSAAQGVERVHHVFRLAPVQPVQVEVSGIEFGADHGAPLLIPPERRPVVAKVACER